MSSSTYAENFVTLLRALSLVEGSYKPVPANPLTSNSTAGSGYSDFYGPGTLGVPVDTTFNVSDPGLGFNSTSFHPASGGAIGADTQCPVVLYDSPPLANQTFWPFDPVTAAIYRYRRQQSVNLGSWQVWFVQENWMVPSLFTCASEPRSAEINIASGWGFVDNARAVLERHWDTFINQTDFDHLASIGINTVRLPIGYWTLGPTFVTGTPFEQYASVYTNAWPRVVRAINMAAQSGIGVLVDVHGATGSQNGQPHSGISDGQTRLFNNAAYMDKTMESYMFLADQLQNVTNVVGIEILNEPNDTPELSDFYSKAITAMRQRSSGGPSLPLYIHDGFNLQKYSTYLSNRSDFVVEDHHSYFVFTPADESEPASQHTSDVTGLISGDLGTADSKDRENLVIGEWSCALTAQSLATQSNPDEARRQFCTTQMGAYTNMSAGWSFWSYNKEDCDADQGWCFKAAVGKSLPDTFFSYGKAPPTGPAELQRVYAAVASMTVPSQSDILKSLQSSPIMAQGTNGTSAWNMATAQQQSSIEGYSDGYQTAKIFTQHGWSRLGFVEQYIRDTLSAMGGFVPQGTEDDYRSGFKVGLADGEGVVAAVLA
ncbi:glycoside hydrolase [Boletus edulis BED1]|uniref:Glycoside hydrolase n=1 Tax=Boletus edulis BED1 TaxID=1328754 RepID=A0AAD4C2L4_BOLED|nr:glycoside hydrolase [Boletus edulis BED1]